MSRSLFIVRVRACHRLYESSWSLRSASEKSKMIRVENEFEKVFTSIRLAEDYIDSNYPVDINPFGHNYEVSVFGGIFQRFYCSPEWRSNFPPFRDWVQGTASELCEKIRQAGFEPPEKPDYCSQKVWKDWWESSTRSLSLLGKESLKTKIGIRTTHTNPFDCLSVFFVEGQDNAVWLEFSDVHELLMEELVEIVESFGLSIRSALEEKDIVLGLFVWWEEHKMNMTTLQRAQVWKLVDPFPYEIVEVPLEGTP